MKIPSSQRVEFFLAAGHRPVLRYDGETYELLPQIGSRITRIHLSDETQVSAQLESYTASTTRLILRGDLLHAGNICRKITLEALNLPKGKGIPRIWQLVETE